MMETKVLLICPQFCRCEISLIFIGKEDHLQKVLLKRIRNNFIEGIDGDNDFLFILLARVQ